MGFGKDRVNLFGFSLALVLCAGTVLSSIGCKNIINRGQSPDSTGMKFTADLNETRYIGKVALPYGLSYTKVEGIGLATQLDGTGSNPRPGGRREHLENEIKSHGVEEADKLLAEKNNSLVLVKGFIPPGARKGDRFDLYVIVPPKSDTESLEHGFRYWKWDSAKIV